MITNALYYGDNLDVLRRHVKDESVDLVYLDPPFNSNANYNVLFAAKDGHQAPAQIQAFEDTWRWDEAAARQFAETVEKGGAVADVLLAFEKFIPASDMLAYLAMMAPRLIELRRVLKSTGSLYLHCDPTASHYLKLLLDAALGAEHFRNEVIWKRTPFAGSSKARAHQYPRSHDVLLFYTKGDEWTWRGPTLPYTDEYLTRFKWDDHDGRGPYRKSLLATYSQATFDRLKADNRLVPAVKAGAQWSYKQYLHESSGTTQIDDVWIDVNALNPVARERLGYPTQKPLALLERILEASSRAGDVVLDPFCGCGTTIEAAQKLRRAWIGIDITHLSIGLIKVRLRDAFRDELTYSVHGEPTTMDGAAKLANEEPYQFQAWALGKVGARQEGSIKKGADKGIDGRAYLRFGESTCQIIFSVKGGKLKATDVRDLRGVIDREKAEIGVLLSFETPTKLMKAEAASAGFYKSPWGDHPRLQLLTVAELLAGAGVDAPKTAGVNQTYRQAPRQLQKVAESLGLFPEDAESPKLQRPRRKK